MVGTDEPSPIGDIQLNKVLDISNNNCPTTLDLKHDDNLSDFGTPLNTFEASKIQNFLDDGEIAAAAASESKTLRILFTGEAKDGYEASPKLTAITEVNKTPDHVPPQPDLGTSPRARKDLARTIALHEPGFEKGYDSDGDIGPFWDAKEDEGEQEEQDDEQDDEEKATTVANEATIEEISDDEDTAEQEQEQTTVAATITRTEPTIGHIPIANDVIDKMLRPAIAMELQKRGLGVKGIKEILQARLKQGIKDKVPVVVLNPNSSKVPSKTKKKKAKKANAPNKSTSTLIKDFPDGCYWRPLIPSSTADEPTNPTFNLARAPTVPQDEVDNVTVKWNFAEKFERPGFLRRHQKLVKLRNGQSDPEFVRKHKL
jgi:hypothetical protein